MMNFIKHIAMRPSFGGKPTQWNKSMGTFTDLKATDIDGKEQDFEQYKGNVFLIVNVASKWGQTKAGYTAMTRFDTTYRDKGLVVMGFPCNQFGGQEPGDEATIKAFVEKNFQSKFPMFSKVDVIGKDTHPVYTFLKSCFPGEITWNFASKFLVDRNGVCVARFEKESWETIEGAIKELLEQKEEQGEEKK